MKLYLNKPPQILRLVFPEILWKIDSTKKKLYLTFDDGPTPEVTSFVLDVLDEYNAKATFFVLGKNIKGNEELFNRIKEKHAIGNHSFSHIKGYSSSMSNYVSDVNKADKIINSKLFRPPYGQIKLSQYSALKQKYKIVMWNVLSGDFDNNISGIQCFNNVVKYSNNGSIIVFHDTLKASNNLKIALPKVLKYFTALNYSFEKIDF
ncbi:MAG: polysaccharide deacetylase family protein [Ichthyobacteriaceae bacterium]|nr:polysaccharide deacetylase family protein [Ichthyobacteriaceae bacterium]